MSNETVRAIQALRILRDKPLRGRDLAEKLRAADTPGSSPQRPHHELEPILLLLQAGLIQVYMKAEYRPGKEIPYMSAERFKQTWAQFGLDSYIFSVSNALSYVQRAFGLYNLDVLEQHAQGDSMVVSPLFGLPRQSHLKHNIFALLPPSALMRPVYDMAIRSAADGLNLSISRAEDFYAGRMSVLEIWEGLNAADVVLGDCTGRHPSVLYELGIAHTLGKHTVIIAQGLDDIPPEFRQLHHIVYENSKEGLSRLCSDLQALLLAFAQVQDSTGETA